MSSGAVTEKVNHDNHNCENTNNGVPIEGVINPQSTIVFKYLLTNACIKSDVHVYCIMYGVTQSTETMVQKHRKDNKLIVEGTERYSIIQTICMGAQTVYPALFFFEQDTFSGIITSADLFENYPV